MGIYQAAFLTPHLLRHGLRSFTLPRLAVQCFIPDRSCVVFSPG